MIALVADASRDVLEAPLCDEAEPACGVALALQLVALTVSHLLALALAELAQRLNINTVFPEFLFQKSVGRWLVIVCSFRKGRNEFLYLPI